MKFIFSLALICIFTIQNLIAQDLISYGLNSWILHTPDDGRKSLYMAPGINSDNWDFSKQTEYKDNGDVIFSGNLSLPLQSSIGHLTAIDKFNYAGYLVGNYSIGWFNDSWNSGAPSSYYSGYGGIKFFTQANPRMVIDYSGNVGIGTMSPDAKLEVFGKSSTGLRINGTNNDFEALSIYNTTSSNLPSGNGAIIQFYNNAVNNNNGVVGASIKSVSVNNFYGWESDLYLRTTRNNSYTTQTILDALVVKGGSGNVGIGTSNPTEKLTVNGTVYSKEVKVDVSAGTGPDYVFEPTYQLPSLTEIENYIKANKHLPEVPSAKEMEANGINLSEMNMLLLKKVEELTLYLIEQNKVILKQNERLEQLEKKN